MRRGLVVSVKLMAGVLAMAVLVSAIALIWPLPLPLSVERSERLLIYNATLIDVVSGQALAGTDILIDGGQIVEVGRQLSVADAARLDASGRFVIPGLFDMHVHSYKLSPVFTHPLFIAAGVTAVRDMGGCLSDDDSWVACAQDKREWDAAVRKGTLVGPRYDQVTSLQIDGGRAIPAGRNPELGAATAAGARERVASDKARGIDFLKPYTMLSADAYFALAVAAQENGMYLAGHQPLAISGLEAVAAGQRSIEHAFLFILDCYPGMNALREVSDLGEIYTNELRLRMIAEHDPLRCSTLHAAMAAAGTAFVPTHTTRKLDAMAIDASFRADPRLATIPAPLRQLWLGDADSMARRAGAGGQASYRAFYEFGLKQTGVAHRAGVTVLAGSDAPDSFVFPGTGLHDELDHLVMAGLSPLDALRAATVEAADFLGLAGQAGVIVPGARADLVLLRENPLLDIRAVREIDAVVLAGGVYHSPELAVMVADVEAAADSWSIWPRFAWYLLRSPIMLRQFAD